LCLPGVARELRDRVGLSEALIRISIGIENVEDLISTLAQGLDMGDSGRELSAQTMDQGGLRSYRAATLETNAQPFSEWRFLDTAWAI
jgi:Cys/Met metabolism PLP-dependent enzyme